ncbi:MAG: hypothetical protein E5X52_30160 [Mesorhizobium sp.]|nr:MAG: hypothetical protein E5X52_30160 [Mesorhizobium sp.]
MVTLSTNFLTLALVTVVVALTTAKGLAVEELMPLVTTGPYTVAQRSHVKETGMSVKFSELDQDLQAFFKELSPALESIQKRQYDDHSVDTLCNMIGYFCNNQINSAVLEHLLAEFGS